MEIQTKALGKIILDTSKNYISVSYKIPNKGYRDRNKGEIFFSFARNINSLNNYYNENSNKIAKIIDDYDYIKELLDKYIINNIFDDKNVLKCLSSVLDYNLVNKIIEYLKSNIVNLNIEIFDDGPLLPDIKMFLDNDITLYNTIKEYIIREFKNDIIISYYNMFYPPDLTISMEQEKIEISVLYEVEKGVYNSTMNFELDEI